MASRRRINYHWQLFLPIALCLCIVFGLIIWYQYKREAEYRAEMLTMQLDLINRRVLKAYNSDQDVRPLNSFLASYFEGSAYEDVRISVYQNDGRLRYSLGTPLPFDTESFTVVDYISTGDDERKVVSDSLGAVYFLATSRSSDGYVEVLSALPFDAEVSDALDVDSMVWLVMMACILMTVFVSYYFTRRLSRSVTLLKDFAYRAATGGHFTGIDKFPKNELGDISREIVTLY
ncbi:hypothetical protein, partial [Duncaniella freteri]